MKKIILMAVMVAGLAGLTSCEDYLTGTNIYNKNLDSFYSTPTEIEEALAGLYLAMYVGQVTSDESLVMNLTDDIVLGGGEAGGEVCYYIDNLSDPGVDTHKELWTNSYKGIYRANALIEVLSDSEKMAKNLSPYYTDPEALKAFVAQALGEAYFMKGFYYFKLGRWFGGVPTINTTSSDRNVPRASYMETFGVAAANFKLAIETFPNKPADAYQTSEFGHANRWVAEGYLARTYLHATGYMTNIEGEPTTEVPYYGMEGALTKQDAIDAIDDIIANSHHALVDDFRNLWPYAHVNYASAKYNDAHGDNILPWAHDLGLVWAGQDGFTSTIEGTQTGNPEVMFSFIAGFGNWNTVGQNNQNRTCLFFGPRDSGSGPFMEGWGQGTTHPSLYADWDKNDTRRMGSIIDVEDKTNFTDGFEKKAQKHYTGFISKKYCTLVIKNQDGGTRSSIYAYIYNQLPGDKQLWCASNYALLRYSDVLLMHSELTETADGMNEVRKRAGLDPIAYSLEALKKERLYEFTYESIRWFDLVRWGDVYKQDNDLTYYGHRVNVLDNLIEATYTLAPDPIQKGLRPIPESEIQLSNGAYEQNPGWE